MLPPIHGQFAAILLSVNALRKYKYKLHSKQKNKHEFFISFKNLFSKFKFLTKPQHLEYANCLKNTLLTNWILYIHGHKLFS